MASSPASGCGVVSVAALHAQLPRPLSPQPEESNRVAPFFDGWYANPDGTISFSFGYSNLNKETVEIPLGPDNFITPKEYDGRQPTSFPVVGAGDDSGGGGGGGAAGAGAATTRELQVGAGGGGGQASGPRAARESQPARPRARRLHRDRPRPTSRAMSSGRCGTRGQTWSVPGAIEVDGVPAQLADGDGLDAAAPAVRTGRARPAAGPMGMRAADRCTPRSARRVDLTVWVTDDAVHEKEPIKVEA